MADLNSRATVTLTVNGKQAAQMLDDLKNKASKLESSLDKAAKAGNKAKTEKLRKELRAVHNQMNQIQKASEGTSRVLASLDSATPKQLQRVYSQLRRELENIQRGTKKWDEQCEAIKRVKAEIDKVNAAQREGLTTGQKIDKIFNDWSGSILAAAAALATFIMAGRQAVSDFAELDQEMANVMKFTSMSREQVEALNAEMAKMDTRTSILKLNEYAEDAGKLGMKTIEDIMGYVRGADQINVALSDIGDGATLVLSKLSSIFGIKDEYGTEQALLKIGSTITELSQNCTASSAYLANFAKRMGGVGKAAGMTMPHLIAIGAVLDANGQTAEMSATAVSKLIMDAYKNSDKFATALQIDAEKFRKVMAEDANAGFLMIIERFKEIGNMDALAPVFKDMGENGARASQVMATLANNIDMLKWEEEEAQKAFDKGTKATEMYNIQNTTVQAKLEKASKRIHELRVELGEKLMPVMSHVIRTSTLIFKTLNFLVDFLIKYKGELVVVTASVAAYSIAVHLATLRTKALAAAQTAHKVVMAAWTAAQHLGTAAVALFTGRVNLARRAFIMFSATIKASPIGLLAASITAVVGGLVLWAKRSSSVTLAQKKMDDATKEASKNYADEKSKIDMLLTTLENENASLEKRQDALEQLNKIVPNYNAELDVTTGKYKANKQALDDYLVSLEKEMKLKAIESQLQELYKQQTEQQLEIDNKQEDIEKRKKTNRQIGTFSQGYGVGSTTEVDVAQQQLSTLQKRLADTNSAIQQLKDFISKSEISSGSSKVSLEQEESDGDFIVSGQSSANGTKTESWLSQRKAQLEKAQTILRISYAQGKIDYEHYREEMLALMEGFYEETLASAKVSEDEKLKLTEDRLKMEKEYVERGLNDEYETSLATLRQMYIDGELSQHQYEQTSQLLTLEHLRQTRNIYAEGSEDWIRANKAYEERLLTDQQSRQKEAEELERKHQEELQKIKDKYFGLNASENKASYDSAMAGLEEVYRLELAAAGDNATERLRIEKAFQDARLALAKQYGQEVEAESKNTLQRINAFLQSDGGKAIMQSFDTLTSQLGNIFGQLTSLIEAETDIQIAKLDSRYDAEISAAEGNTYKVKQLEEQKQKEQARIKNEANRKMFSMQVIQAVAQTATSALNAYSSAAAIPLVGYLIAPVAASMALAAGMLQVAAIKKQQAASEAKGYQRGGFTDRGANSDVVGVVHANEWVASERLVSSPQARPMIDRLEYAQRTNTIGQLNQTGTDSRVDDTLRQNALVMSAYIDTMNKLERRLNEPFVTVNTVTGDAGIKKAQDDYNKLMKNKSPKS